MTKTEILVSPHQPTETDAPLVYIEPANGTRKFTEGSTTLESIRSAFVALQPSPACEYRLGGPCLHIVSAQPEKTPA